MKEHLNLSRNEINFRRYLKKYHPDKYEQLIWLEVSEATESIKKMQEIR